MICAGRLTPPPQSRISKSRGDTQGHRTSEPWREATAPLMGPPACVCKKAAQPVKNASERCLDCVCFFAPRRFRRANASDGLSWAFLLPRGRQVPTRDSRKVIRASIDPKTAVNATPRSKAARDGLMAWRRPGARHHPAGGRTRQPKLLCLCTFAVALIQLRFPGSMSLRYS
jgi:hypothetical protein